MLILQDLHVQKGQIVEAGTLLCTLADFSQLMIEGQAFETEAGLITMPNSRIGRYLRMLT